MCIGKVKVFFLFCILLKLISCKELPNISIELVNSGFHRDLYYGIQFEKLEETCEYFLEQKLPAAVYISVDQLNDLTRLKKLDAVYPSHVDVEIPTEKARPFSVLLNVLQKSYQAINLPIHFRYHAPGDKSFVRVNLDTPFMYMRCEDDSHLPKNTEVTKYCLNGTKFTRDVVMNSNLNECNWLKIDYNIYIKNPLKANIPIGDVNLKYPVIYVTIIISWIGCGCILFTTHNKMKTIRKKLK